MTETPRLGSFLTDISLADHIVACARRALQGQTPESLRTYSFSFDERRRSILLRAEVAREPTESEWDDLSTVEAEIAADFTDLDEIETFIAVVPVGQPTRPLPGGVAFSREDGPAIRAAE